jgi:hypothetical protein
MALEQISVAAVLRPAVSVSFPVGVVEAAAIRCDVLPRVGQAM